MLSIVELRDFLENNGAHYEMLSHELPIFTTQDAAQYFDIKKAAPVFIIDTGQIFIALIVSFMRGKIDFKAMGKTLGYSKFRLASKERVEEITGYTIGKVPLIGHNLPCVFDKSLLEYDFVFGGSGDEYHTLKIASKDVLRLNNVIHYIG